MYYKPVAPQLVWATTHLIQLSKLGALGNLTVTNINKDIQGPLIDSLATHLWLVATYKLENPGIDSQYTVVVLFLCLFTPKKYLSNDSLDES